LWKAFLRFQKPKNSLDEKNIFAKNAKNSPKTDFHGSFSIGLLGDSDTGCVIWPL